MTKTTIRRALLIIIGGGLALCVLVIAFNILRFNTTIGLDKFTSDSNKQDSIYCEGKEYIASSDTGLVPLELNFLPFGCVDNSAERFLFKIKGTKNNDWIYMKYNAEVMIQDVQLYRESAQSEPEFFTAEFDRIIVSMRSMDDFNPGPDTLAVIDESEKVSNIVSMIKNIENVTIFDEQQPGVDL